MEDKEVGELWRGHGGGSPKEHHNCQICVLIRKLVEERAKFYEKHTQVQAWITLAQGRQLALRDFNIDPKGWNEKA